MRKRTNVILFIVIFTLVILGPRIFGVRNILTKILPVMLLSVGIVRHAFAYKGRLYVGRVLNQADFVLLGCYAVIIMVAILRTGNPESSLISNLSKCIQLLCVLLYVYLFMSEYLQHSSDLQKVGQELVKLILIPPTLAVVVHCALYILMYNSSKSILSDGEQYAAILGAFGLSVQKKLLPITDTHPNHVGIYAGSIFAMFLTLLAFIRLKGIEKLFFYVCYAAVGVMLLLVDSRASIAYSLLVPVFIVLISKIRTYSFFYLFVFVLPFMPLVMLSTLEAFSHAEVAKEVSRGGSDEIATGNSRKFVWQGNLEELLDAKLIHFVGYGEIGHYTSGASRKYAHHFGPDPEKLISANCHNNLLQAIMDAGYIGACLFLFLIFIVIKNCIFLLRRGFRFAYALLAFIFYYMLSGIMEAIFGFSHSAYNSIFFAVILCTFLVKNEYLKQMRQANAADERPVSIRQPQRITA